MNNPLNELTTSQQRELYEICWRFEQGLSEGKQISPADFVPVDCSFDSELLIAELVEIQNDWLEKTEQHQRKLSPMNDLRYDLREEIARGGSAVVWRVWDKHLQRETAVKCLLDSQDNDAMRARLEREARLLARLVHPGIVPIHELSKFADGRPFVSMKLVEGKTLLQLLTASPPISKKVAVEIFTKVCQAMAYAHARSIIHRDLKPSNIMVGAFGEVQIMDWGLGKDLDNSESSDLHDISPETTSSHQTRSEIVGGETTFKVKRPRDVMRRDIANDSTRIDSTLNGSVIGTLAYMAPEQAQGRLDTVDRRSDVFSLGAILCRILIGTPPYQGANEAQLLEQARRCELDDVFHRLRGCRDRRMADLAVRCMSVDPKLRPADAQQVVDLLAEIRSANNRRTLALVTLGVFALFFSGVAISRLGNNAKRMDPHALTSIEEKPAAPADQSVANIEQPSPPKVQPEIELDLTDPGTIQTLFEAKQFRLLVSSYPPALAKHPANYFLHRNICSSLLSLGRVVEAEAVAKTLVKLGEQQAEPYFLLGVSLLMQGKNQQAYQELLISKSKLSIGEQTNLPIDDQIARAKHWIEIEEEIATTEIPNTDAMTFDQVVELARVCEFSRPLSALELYNRALALALTPKERSYQLYHIIVGSHRIYQRDDLSSEDRNALVEVLINWMEEQFNYATNNPTVDSASKAELHNLLRHGQEFAYIRAISQDKRVDQAARDRLTGLLKAIDPPR